MDNKTTHTCLFGNKKVLNNCFSLLDFKVKACRGTIYLLLFLHVTPLTPTRKVLSTPHGITAGPLLLIVLNSLTREIY